MVVCVINIWDLILRCSFQLFTYQTGWTESFAGDGGMLGTNST